MFQNVKKQGRLQLFDKGISQNKMFNDFFTPEQISPRKTPIFRLNFTESYDFSSLMQKDLFQIVSPHVESLMDQKRKIISWLKKIPLIDRINILTYTNKEFVCLIRAMYQKKQLQYQDVSSVTFTISHIQQTDEFDLMSIANNKKLNKDYLLAEDELLSNIRVMSRYTQFDSITFSDNFLRNVDNIFHYFDVLGDGIAHQLTNADYERLKKLPNSFMFYDPNEGHCYRKVTIGAWITQVLMKDISMKYLQSQIQPKTQTLNQLKDQSKQLQKHWKIITPDRKNEIIKKVLQMKSIDLYQQHRSMVKVTRNGFPPIQKSDKVPSLLKNILNSGEKQIFDILFYTDLAQTLESHSILKFNIANQIEEEIQKYKETQENFLRQAKMKKKKRKIKQFAKFQEQKYTKINTIQRNATKKITNLQVNLSNGSKPQQKIISQTQDLKQNEVIVKGTDLFYKKLEISQTQNIICFEGNYDESNKSCEQQTKSQNTLHSQTKKTKPKKKKKNKKKIKAKDSINQKQDAQRKQQSEQQDNGLMQSQKSSLKQMDSFEQFTKMRKSSSNNTIQADRHSQKSSETTNDLSEQLQEEIQNKKQKKQKSPKQVTVENKFLDDPLSEIMKDMQKKIAFYNKQRKIIINRLSYVFAQHELSFKLYGSSSCDLALPSSDIDIVVDPSIVNYFYFSYSNYRKKIINSLEYLQKVFQKFQWAKDFLLLPGANTPLLTFSVNPNIDFQFEQSNFQYNNKKQLKQQIRISVDITIEPYVNMTDDIPLHLGMQSTELIKEWTATFPFYGQLLLLLKLFTKNQNLNKMYHGGIGSFMQAIILAGFFKNFFMGLNISLNDFQFKRQKFEQILPSNFNLTKIFLEYCDFIQRFQQDKQILDINQTKSIALKTQSVPKQRLAIVNPLTGKIMSQRCTTFPLYKKILEKAHQTIHSRSQTQMRQQLNIMFQA